jgi:hypothetical protein
MEELKDKYQKTGAILREDSYDLKSESRRTLAKIKSAMNKRDDIKIYKVKDLVIETTFSIEESPILNLLKNTYGKESIQVIERRVEEIEP